MKVGAHISSAKPFSDAVKRAKNIGCECMQIFVNPPQRWNPSLISDEEIQRFVEYNLEAKIHPIIIHSIYLINLASSNPFYYEQSVKSLIDDMEKAKRIGAFGVNFHVGSTKGAEIVDVIDKIISAMNEILEKTPDGPYLIIENSAGAGNIVGDTIEEISLITKKIKTDRVRVLIDTAHAFESGYNLDKEDGLNNFIQKFDNEIGLDKLVGFHFNDSKTEYNSKRDRHADLGFGYIGIEPFKRIINHPKLSDKFAILETPEDEMAWADQINLLKEIRTK